MKRCDCCGELIKGKPREVTPEAPTGAAPTVYVCPDPCRPAVPRQTAPAGFYR